ncbi:MAG TPA: hypothetical protein VF911_09225, partial [Thermoanaerobaculia bacterium]
RRSTKSRVLPGMPTIDARRAKSPPLHRKANARLDVRAMYRVGVQDLEDDDRDEPIEPVVEPTACAACGSPDIARTSRGLMFAVAAAATIGVGVAVGLTDAAFFAVLAFGVYFLISGRWRCSECGATWD